MATPDLERMVLELWARDQIARVPRRYSRGVDRRDWTMVRSCFTDDAAAEGSRSSGPIDAYLADLRAGVEAFGTTMHFLGNQLVDVEGDADHGSVETYGVAYHWKREQPAGAPDPGDLVVGVRYFDDLVRRDGVWRIAHRRVESSWLVTGPIGGPPPG
jgi:hypothetical protein